MKELLFSITKRDFKIDYFSGRGAGGQSRNKNQNCVRLRHIASGASATGQSNKERSANMKQAFNGIVKHPKFKLWHHSRVAEMVSGETIEDKLDRYMTEDNLKVEKKVNNKWVLVEDTE